MIDLHGRVVLITGAGGAIGSAAARTLAGAGATVLAQDVRAEPVQRLVDELGASARAFVSDLSDPAAAARLWDDALAVHGRIDVLVNNAGIFPAAELDAPLEDWVRVWNLLARREPRRARDPVQGRRDHVRRPGRRRDHRQHGQPRRVPGRGPRLLALRRREGRRSWR